MTGLITKYLTTRIRGKQRSLELHFLHSAFVVIYLFRLAIIKYFLFVNSNRLDSISTHIRLLEKMHGSLSVTRSDADAVRRARVDLVLCLQNIWRERTFEEGEFLQSN